MSYPDLNENEVEIYLLLDGDEKHIPAPKYFWKVLYDEIKEQAVAFIGLNDPHADDISPDEEFCISVCDLVKGYVLLETIFSLIKAEIRANFEFFNMTISLYSVCNISRVDWNIDEEKKGHMSCCTIHDLNDKIPYSPKLGDIGLLTILE